MIKSTITFDIAPSDAAHPIGVEVWLDHQSVIDIPELTQLMPVICEFDDELEQPHVLKIIIKNKTAEHTKIDSQGQIVQDSVVEIKNFKLDDIAIEQIIYDHAVYHHNFNGSGNWSDNKFYNTAGCNGTISLEFSSPAYLWLLEKM